MASAEAHRAIGWAAGVAAAALVIEAGAAGPLYWHALAALVAGRVGGVFPDRFEEAWWTRKRIQLIPHRTWTHIAALWIALLVGAYHFIGLQPWAPIAFGFALGGVSHLAADLPNPQGIPLLWKKRTSLDLWKSGRADTLVAGAAWALALWFTDRALLDGAGTAWAVSAARAVTGAAIDGSI